MCDTHLTRREILVTAAMAAGAVMAGGSAAHASPAVPAVDVLPGLAIHPRDAWGADLPPKGTIRREDARFLLVHHSATNTSNDTRSKIRDSYRLHTGPTKRWPDVCYEFIIGRQGDVWEGRAGSMAGPVVADATNGNQGFAQLVCMVGDYTSTLPTAAAHASLAKVLAWLAVRDDIDISSGATTSFVSRGTQRWPAGVTVTTPTIAGHRDMSYTACPGDAFYPTLAGVRTAAIAQREAWRTTLRPALRVRHSTP